jgi:RNA polymerase sigma factor (sigma-70 family)
MSKIENFGAGARVAKRKLQGKALQQKESELSKLFARQNKEEFFQQTLPLLQPLKSYIKRQLRIAYLGMEIRTPVSTSSDILDQVMLRAFRSYNKKPESLTLEQWLYQIANETLKGYISRIRLREGRQKSLETQREAELGSLEEIPFTADAGGKVWLPEELDDTEYRPRDFFPPASQSDPEEQLEKGEEVNRILEALAHVPESERIVFDLFILERFSKEEIARIAHVSPDEVPRISERVREHVLCEIKKPPAKLPRQEKAS